MKPLFILLLILTLFCSCNSIKPWAFKEVVSNNPQFNSTLLTYQSDDELMGVGVEILKGIFGTFGYLNVHSRQIPSLPDAPSKSIVVLLIDEKKFPYNADRMEGGQKLLLPQEATAQLTSSLLNNQSVTIYLDGFKSTLEPTNFANMYKKIL
jgi:hypothetical protein